MPIKNIVNIFEDRNLNLLFFNNIVNMDTSDVLLGFNFGFHSLGQANIPTNEVFSILIRFNYVKFRFESFLINHNNIPQNFTQDIEENCDLFTGNFNILMISLIINDMLIEDYITDKTLMLIEYLIDNKYLVDIGGEAKEKETEGRVDRMELSVPSNLQIILPSAFPPVAGASSKLEHNIDAEKILLKYSPKVLEQYDEYSMYNCSHYDLQQLGMYVLIVECIKTSFKQYFMGNINLGPIKIQELSDILESNIAKINKNINQLIFKD